MVAGRKALPFIVALGVAFAGAPAALAAPMCLGHEATIVGPEGPEILRGTAGRDVIVARGGHDQVFGREGNDLICGGQGFDELTLRAGSRQGAWATR
jgi:hypothetical protein